jgi:hypothetical protein
MRHLSEPHPEAVMGSAKWGRTTALAEQRTLLKQFGEGQICPKKRTPVMLSKPKPNKKSPKAHSVLITAH